MDDESAVQITDDLFRRESGRMVAALVARLGTSRLQLAEDVVQEAMVKALQTWPYRGIPDNPAAWLMQSAKNLAIDVLRRERRWGGKAEGIAAVEAQWLASPTESSSHEPLADDTLRMMFVCFHPQLSIEAQTALALRTLCGLSPGEIAAAFLTSEAAIAKRLVRTRQHIRDLALPFVVPEPHELPARLAGVLGTLYLLFNEGYKASAGDRLVREDLCREAIRLTRLLTSQPVTATPAAHALLALMLFTGSRLGARTDDAGNLLRLHEQDRASWDRSMISEGARQLAMASSGDTLSPYHLEAGIAATHSFAENVTDTDWRRILDLYDQLLILAPSPITAMNRAVAVARVHGPQSGMAALDAILPCRTIESQHLYHAIRGTFAAELGQLAEAMTCFRRAGDLASLPAERDFIARRMNECQVALEARP